MKINLSSVLAQNMTLVYDALDVNAVDVTKLRSITSTNAVVLNTPDAIVGIAPDLGLVVQFGDRRIRVSMQKAEAGLEFPLWETTANLHQLAPSATLTAYGFNYDILIKVEGADAAQMLTTRFLADYSSVESALDGELVALIPRLLFLHADARHDLTLEPLSNSEVKGHLNVHFDATQLPEVDVLKASYLQHFDYLLSVLPGLLYGAE